MLNQYVPKIYICIPIFNRIEYTLKCIESIYNQSYPNFQIIICDDNSSDFSFEIISKKYPKTILLKGNGNLWWTGATNKCIEYALKTGINSDFIYTLNNDTELYPNTLEKLIELTKLFPNSIIGTLNVFYNNHNLIENSAFIKKKTGRFKRVNKFGEELDSKIEIKKVSALSGKGVLIPFNLFQKIGLYNFEKLPHYHADFEFSYRACKNGFPILLSYSSKLKSHQNLSGIGSVTSKPNIKEFIKSFKSIKSTHHLPSLYNFYKLIYGKSYLLYFLSSLIFIHIGFIKRYLKHKIQ